MDHVFLLPCDSVTTRKPTHLATLLGSCVSVCLSNPTQRTAGMNHYMLPVATSTSEPGKYGDTSIRQMLQTLFTLDADPKHYKARVYGGGKVIGHLGTLGDIGARNIDVARRMLEAYSIRISYEDVGGSKGRRIDFNTETDAIDCRVVGVGSSGSRRSVTAEVHTRVLIVDDSAVTRRLIRRGLESCAGIKVVGEASNAFEARDQVLSQNPDVLALDVEMPRLDGLAFLRQLMIHLSKPVVVLSSLATPGSDLVAHARAAGAVDVIDKARLEPAKGLDGIRNVLAPALVRAARSRQSK
jgi:two-component system chemotaxis response regulator CheB